MQTFILCKGCGAKRVHHAQGYCINCYHKVVVRQTGEFDRGEVNSKISLKQQIQRNKGRAISLELTKERLEQLYNAEMRSMGDIARQFMCSRAYILLLLKKYNLPIRSKSAARAEAKKQGKNVHFSSINEDFFKNQTPEAAYVLGFIYADGNIANGLNYFSISQKEPEILHKIKEIMGSEHTIARKKTQNLHVLTIGNKVMINDLLKLGLTA